MKFTVEVEEFYLEEGELAVELKEQIKRDVVAQIREVTKKQVDEFMNTYVKNEIHNQLQGRVQSMMDEFLSSGLVKDNYGNPPQMAVKDWISKTFTDKRADIHKSIENQVKKAVSELQARYDLMFASQLIVKIKDQGFLKEDVARLLLSGEGKS